MYFNCTPPMINTCLMWVIQNSKWEVHHLATLTGFDLWVPPDQVCSENVPLLHSELRELDKIFFHVEAPYEICLDSNVIS